MIEKSPTEEIRESPSTPPRRSHPFRLIASIISTTLLVVSLLAYRLGVDSNQDWGLSRKLMFLLGGLGLVTSQRDVLSGFVLHAAQFVGDHLRRYLNLLLDQQPVQKGLQVYAVFSNSLRAWARSQPLIFRIRRRWLQPIGSLVERQKTAAPGSWFLGTRLRQAYSICLFTGLAVVLFYIWLVSIGFWGTWRPTTDYYDRLASAFLQGQVELLDEPGQELLKVEDPYNIDQRGNVPYLWDASLYEGKYYLYWGAAPALALLPLKLATGAVIGDQYLTFAFVCGAFIFSLLIMLALWKEFDSLPAWTVLPAALAAGLINPMPWMLSRPAVYEAAISGGQFFFLAGLFCAYSSLSGDTISARRACLASFCWAFAIGSRATLLPGVLIFLMTGMLVLHFNGSYRRPEKKRLFLVALWGPILLGIMLLGWYNFARFGNVLDFGHRYQLTGMNLNQMYDRIISVSHVVPNAYNYLLNPMRRLEVFPYVKPRWGGQFALPIPGATSNIYYSEQVTGILCSSPFLLLAILPLAFYWRDIHGWVGAGSKIRDIAARIFSDRKWIVFLSLTAGVMLLFAPILFFVVCTMRYLADAVPTLSILAAGGLWMGYERLRTHRTARKFFSLFALGLTFGSVLIGMLLAITGYQARFEQFNPFLFERLTRIFTF